MTTPQSVTPVASYGIDLVDKDKAGGLLLALLEHVPHPAGTHSNEHFHKIRTTDSEERNAGLARNGPGQQRFPCSGRPDHEDALGDTRTQFLEFARILEEIDNLPEFFLGLLDAGHILEGHLVPLHVHHARLAFAEAHRSPPGLLHLVAKKKKKQDNKDQDGQKTQQDRSQVVCLRPIGHLAVEKHIELFLHGHDVDRNTDFLGFEFPDRFKPHGLPRLTGSHQISVSCIGDGSKPESIRLQEHFISNDPLLEFSERAVLILQSRGGLRRHTLHAGAQQSGQLGTIQIKIDPDPERPRRLVLAADIRGILRPVTYDLRVERGFISNHFEWILLHFLDDQPLLQIGLELAEGDRLALALPGA